MDRQIQAIVRAIENISKNHRSYKVFRDFVELAAIWISNSVDPVHYASREKNALQTQSKYTNEENLRIHNAFLLLVDTINQNTNRMILTDILGRVFEQLAIKVTAQDFTPAGLTDVAAKLTATNIPKDLPECGYIVLSEPTCGSGAMALSYAEQLIMSGKSCFSQLVTLAVDIEIRAVHMTYIQLSLYGMPAVVLHGNTLTCEEYDRWYTPMYIKDNWVWRQPLGFTDTRAADDEILKRMTEPFYAAARYVDTLSKKNESTLQQKKKESKIYEKHE